jgi:hypothetical protein
MEKEKRRDLRRKGNEKYAKVGLYPSVDFWIL